MYRHEQKKPPKTIEDDILVDDIDVPNVYIPPKKTEIFETKWTWKYTISHYKMTKIQLAAMFGWNRK